MRRSLSWGVSTLVLALVAGCGGDSGGDGDDPTPRADDSAASPAAVEEASPAASEPAAPEELTVVRDRFCRDLDLAALGAASGSSGDASIAQEFKPGDQSIGMPKAEGWICWVGLGSGVLIAEVSEKELSEAEFARSASEPKYDGTTGKCTKVTDDTLGSGTVGYDCPFEGALTLAIVVRYAHHDGARVRCQLQSNDVKQLGALQETAQGVCPIVLEAVAG